MSVHGEFERYLDILVATLRESDRPELQPHADELERAGASHELPLEERARRVLDGPLGQPDPEWQGFPRADETADSLRAISRIILGR